MQIPTRATLVPCREESIDFETTGNIFIEGDNLEVLKLLYKPLLWADKGDLHRSPLQHRRAILFIPDNYADPLNPYLQLTGQKDESGNLLTSNVETSGRYHSALVDNDVSPAVSCPTTLTG